MNQEPFKPKNREQPSLLPLERPQDNVTFSVFEQPEVPNDGFEAYIDKRVLEQIAHETEIASPNETIGLLSGRVCKDSKGPYTLIIASMGAKPGEVDSTPGHVKISGQGHAQIRRRLETHLPYLEIVGWYHSHPTYPAAFSQEDSCEQSTWTDQNHIGVVVSGRSDAYPFGVYRGPKSILLRRRSSQNTFASSPDRERSYDPIYSTDDKTAHFVQADLRKEEQSLRSNTDAPGDGKYTRVHPDPNPELEILSKRVSYLSIILLTSILTLTAVIIWHILEARASELRLTNLIDRARESPGRASDAATNSNTRSPDVKNLNNTNSLSHNEVARKEDANASPDRQAQGKKADHKRGRR